MSFKDEYTTSDKILIEDSSLKSMSDEELLNLSKDKPDFKLEKEKIVLSNDFYMLGQYLECVSNKMVK